MNRNGFANIIIISIIAFIAIVGGFFVYRKSKISQTLSPSMAEAELSLKSKDTLTQYAAANTLDLSRNSKYETMNILQICSFSWI